MKLSRLFRSPVAVLAAVVIVSGSVFAFANAITAQGNYNTAGNPINAGSFQVTANGYAINDIKFLPEGDNLIYATTIFTLSQNAVVTPTDALNTEVRVKLVSGDTTYRSCSFNDSLQSVSHDYPVNTWVCNNSSWSPRVVMSDVNELNVVAVTKNWTDPQN